MPTTGLVEAKFGPVAKALARCGPGVAVAAYADGHLVVDLRSDDVPADALFCTWSSIKPVTAACLLLLVERGLLGLEDPVAQHWAELDDDRLQVRHLLTHTAGRIRPPAALTDWPAMVAGLAAAPPEWPPGSVLCEHAFTFGHLVGELVLRLDGRTPGRFLAEEVAGPMGLDLHVGLTSDQVARVVDTVGIDPAWWAAAGGPAGEARALALGAPVDPNAPAWRSAEVPAANGHATAAGLAGFWQAYLRGDLPAALGVPGATGFDHFAGEPLTWTLGAARLDDGAPGMGGLGGQWAGAVPRLGLAWAFLTSRAGDHLRAQLVEDALVRCCTR